MSHKSLCNPLRNRARVPTACRETLISPHPWSEWLNRGASACLPVRRAEPAQTTFSRGGRGEGHHPLITKFSPSPFSFLTTAETPMRLHLYTKLLVSLIHPYFLHHGAKIRPSWPHYWSSRKPDFPISKTRSTFVPKNQIHHENKTQALRPSLTVRSLSEGGCARPAA